MANLTNTAIDALPIGKYLKDDRIPGLTVHRNNSGTWSWKIYFRTKLGTTRRPKLGDYPILSIAKARDLARETLNEVYAGNDPVLDRIIAKGEPTMTELWGRCEREIYCNGKDWDKEAKRLFHSRIEPRLGSTRVRAVDYASVKLLHQGLSETPYEANRALAVLGRIMKEAERWGYRDAGSNPCPNVERFKEQKRRRYASPEEIQAIGAILDRKAAEAPIWICGAAFIYALLFTGARPSEIERASPNQLERIEKDGVTYGVLRIDEGKTGQRNVFLPPQAMALFDKMPPNRRHLCGDFHRTFPRRLWEIVKKEVGCHDLWGRDLRRTFATVALSNGVPIGHVGELLGHRSSQTTKIYALLMEDQAHSAAAVTATKIQDILRGSSDK